MNDRYDHDPRKSGDFDLRLHLSLRERPQLFVDAAGEVIF